MMCCECLISLLTFFFFFGKGKRKINARQCFSLKSFTNIESFQVSSFFLQSFRCLFNFNHSNGLGNYYFLSVYFVSILALYTWLLRLHVCPSFVINFKRADFMIIVDFHNFRICGNFLIMKLRVFSHFKFNNLLDLKIWCVS